MKIKIISFFTLFFTLFFSNSSFSIDSPNHLVKAKVLFNEIYDINISEGQYKVSVELLLSWDGNIDLFVKKFSDNFRANRKDNTNYKKYTYKIKSKY